MKIIILIISVIACGLCGHRQGNTNNLKGKPASVISIFSNVENYGTARPIKHLIRKEYDYYNIKGQLIHNIDSSYFDGISGAISDYKYNSAGKPVEWAVYWGNGTLWQKKMYKYNKNNQLVDELHYYGNLQELSFRAIYLYDINNSLIEINTYNREKLSQRSRFQYNKQHHLILINDHYANGELVDSCVIKYDLKGNKIKQVHNFSVGATTTEYYNSKGEIISSTENYPRTNLNETTQYTYTQFDKMGNWLYQTVLKRANYVNDIIRQITYYP